MKREKRRGTRTENSREEDEPTKQMEIAASDIAEPGECHVGELREGSISRTRQ